MMKHFETSRKTVPIKGSRTKQQKSEILEVPEKHNLPTKAQLQDNLSHQGLGRWQLELEFLTGRSETGADVRKNNRYVKTEPHCGGEAQPPPPSQPKASNGSFENNMRAEPAVPLQLFCPSEGQSRMEKKGNAVPGLPRMPDSDGRTTDEPLVLTVTQVGAQKVPPLPLVGQQLNQVLFLLLDAYLDEDFVADPVCSPHQNTHRSLSPN